MELIMSMPESINQTIR
jgi:hypothetical protein